MTVRYHQALDWFKEKMNQKLSENTDKEHWKDTPASMLYTWMLGEAGEIVQAWCNDDHEEIIRECADVANFAMMIADKSRRELEKRAKAQP